MTASVLEKAIEKWGKEAQTIVAMEECAERIKECSKMLRGQGNIDHLIEEIADVLICIEQLEIIYDIDNGDVLTASKYENKDGISVTTYEVICDSVEILDRRTQNAGTDEQKAEDAAILDGAEVLTGDEDLPF